MYLFAYKNKEIETKKKIIIIVIKKKKRFYSIQMLEFYTEMKKIYYTDYNEIMPGSQLKLICFINFENNMIIFLEEKITLFSLFFFVVRKWILI